VKDYFALFLLTLTTIARVKHLAASMSDSVCLYVCLFVRMIKPERFETKIYLALLFNFLLGFNCFFDCIIVFKYTLVT